MMTRGILLVGESGSGKSRLALSLLYEGARLVADDVVELTPSPRWTIGRAPEKIKGLIEIRGVGIVDVRRTLGSPFVLDESSIDVVVRLAGNGIGRQPRAAADIGTVNLLGREIPEIRVGADIDAHGLMCVISDYILGGSRGSGKIDGLLGGSE
jgi:HPr kinase/phosphorylase